MKVLFKLFNYVFFLRINEPRFEIVLARNYKTVKTYKQTLWKLRPGNHWWITWDLGATTSNNIRCSPPLITSPPPAQPPRQHKGLISHKLGDLQRHRKCKYEIWKWRWRNKSDIEGSAEPFRVTRQLYGAVHHPRDVRGELLGAAFFTASTPSSS